MKSKDRKKDVKMKVDKKTGIALALIFLAVLAAAFMSANGKPGGEVVQTSTTTITAVVGTENSADASNPNVKVEVYHFHRTSQCWSCITLGALAEKTVNTYFKEELASGKIVFGHINGELPENKELVNKYGATGSSLWIGTYIDGKFNKEENIKVWYKLNNEEDYMSYLKGVLDKRLKGDLS